MYAQYLGCDAFYSTFLDCRSSRNWYVSYLISFSTVKGIKRINYTQSQLIYNLRCAFACCTKSCFQMLAKVKYVNPPNYWNFPDFQPNYCLEAQIC